MYSSELMQSYAAVRARLYGKPTRIVAKTETVEPSSVVEPPAPLDMLKPCSWRFLLALAALRNGVDTTDILGPSRSRYIMAARHEAIWLIAFHTNSSAAGIGRLLGRNHTTVLSSLKRFPARERKPRIPFLVDAVKRGYEQGLPVKEIAKTMGISADYVRTIAYRAGIRHPKYAEGW